jgi:hypothetical protein
MNEKLYLDTLKETVDSVSEERWREKLSNIMNNGKYRKL